MNANDSNGWKKFSLKDAKTQGSFQALEKFRQDYKINKDISRTLENSNATVQYQDRQNHLQAELFKPERKKIILPTNDSA